MHPGHGREDIFLAPPGTKVGLLFPRAGQFKAEGGFATFTVVGFFKSGMSEYDSTHVYVPLERLQDQRLLRDVHGRGAVNQIQIKVKPGVNLDQMAEKIQDALDELQPAFFRVETWEKKQGPLLGAVAVEQSILNILLFFIIAVAGFGILAIFSMIVVEKTRDIGVMKALGASTAGIRGIFLGLRAAPGRSRQRGGHGRRAALRPLYQRVREGARARSWAARSSMTRSTTSTRSRRSSQPFTVGWIVVGAHVDRRAGQHLAGPPRGPRPSGPIAAFRVGPHGTLTASRLKPDLPQSTEGEDDDRPAQSMWSDQELLERAERGPGSARRRSGSRARRDGRRGGLERVGQEHAAAHPGVARRARFRRGLASKTRGSTISRRRSATGCGTGPSGSSSSSITCFRN